MKKIISLVNYKGGAGKTTLASLIALHLGQVEKKSVRVRDLDKGGDAEAFIQNLDDDSIKLFSIDEDQDDYDYLIIDAPGGIQKGELEKIANISDLLLVPFALMPTDIRRTKQTCDALDPYKEKTRLVFNNVNKQTQAFAQRKNVVAALGMNALKSHLCKRVAYGYALVDGLKSLTTDCRIELRKLVKEITT